MTKELEMNTQLWQASPRATSARAFAIRIASRQRLPREPRVRSFAELLFLERPEASGPILLGTQRSRYLEVGRPELRRAAVRCGEAFASLGLEPGDTVCLVRLPRTSEAQLAVALIAMSAWGLRVLLPMAVEPERFGAWLETTRARCVFWAASEVQRLAIEADRALLDRLEREARARSLPTHCLERGLGLDRLAREDGEAIAASHPAARAMIDRGSASAECLVLTTSGSDGHGKLVRFRQRAFLSSCASWERAGLFDAERLGGRALCLLLAHTMGVRALWNAVWTGQPICLIPPEWFEEHPARVRAFLLRMRPEHITGGPAAFRTLLELARVFPDLKRSCLAELRCAVSSGAPFDPELARRLESALGLSLSNAFGTTETQQILSTLVAGPIPRGPGALGNPLPGVELGLEPLPGARGQYRLHVASPFAGAGLDASDPEWVATGDVVALDDGGLRHVGRDADDFVKDGFGLKIPRRRVDELWRGLPAPVVHLEAFPLREEPGLGALIFVEADGRKGVSVEGVVDPTRERALCRRVRGLVAGRLESLRRELEELEHRHLAVIRFACLRDAPPRTAKGTIARGELTQRYASLRETIAARRADVPWIIRLERSCAGESSAIRATAPRLGRLLKLARLDKDYVAASGDRLRYRSGAEEREVIDFVGGFGSGLLGHRHPEVVEAARRFLASDTPPLGEQGSAGRARGEHARRLSELVGRETGEAYVVRHASTGAEAVEMALAHAMLEREEDLHRHLRRRLQAGASSPPDELRRSEARCRAVLGGEHVKVLAIEGAYHGASLAARSVLGSARRRRPYAAMSGIEPIFLPRDLAPEDLEDLLAAETVELEGGVRISRVIAAIAEPIQGEGGVREVSPDLLAALGRQQFPLVVDEIQCGLGRTGRLLASGGIAGAYYLFGKALGGGLAKLSALLVPRTRYVGRFDEHYASTFAGDPFSCAIGLRVLELLEHEQVSARAEERGGRIAAALQRVQAAYPEILCAVRGRGLMQALELAPAAITSFSLRALTQHEHLGLAASAYLFHRHGVRLLPTLSAPNVLRVEPSAWIDDKAIDALESALLAFCELVRGGRSRALLAPIIAEEREAPADPRSPRPDRRPAISTELERPAPGAARVGFVGHFADPASELALADPGLAAASTTERLALFGALTELLEARPIRVCARNLFDGRLWLDSVICAVDAATLEAAREGLDRERLVERIQEAVELCAADGASVIVLGAFTSIISRNGLAIRPPAGTRLVTGNALTAAVAAHRLRAACARAGLSPADPALRLGLVGATGNIGAALARRLLLDEQGFQRALLVASSRPRCAALAAQLRTQRAGLELGVSTELAELSSCQVIGLAASASAPILEAHHLGSTRPLLVGDVSVPGAVAASVHALEGVAVVPLAGVLPLPRDPGFVMSAHSPAGTVFACAAEGLLVALEPEATAELSLRGEIEPGAVAVLERLAIAHGLLPKREGER
jgi:4-aminobutyrate aminotransferase-like enzyme/predicted amino acid dehydrogenase/acyl-coenzyme A synthetase/AMP-(fatty) acid ligase